MMLLESEKCKCFAAAMTAGSCLAEEILGGLQLLLKSSSKFSVLTMYQAAGRATMRVMRQTCGRLADLASELSRQAPLPLRKSVVMLLRVWLTWPELSCVSGGGRSGAAALARSIYVADLILQLCGPPKGEVQNKLSRYLGALAVKYCTACSAAQLLRRSAHSELSQPWLGISASKDVITCTHSCLPGSKAPGTLQPATRATCILSKLPEVPAC